MSIVAAPERDCEKRWRGADFSHLRSQHSPQTFKAECLELLLVKALTVMKGSIVFYYVYSILSLFRWYQIFYTIEPLKKKFLP